jgi:hypothetical protein
MNSTEFDCYLKDRYEDQVKWYDKKSMYNQKWAKRFQVAIITLSSLTPISAALSLTYCTIVFSLVLTILFGISRYYQFDELWKKYRTTCETLKKERYKQMYSIGEYESVDDKEKLFIERVESEISKENTEWITIMKRGSKKEE